eukprot:750218-Rhodomonas_salina.2
MLRYPCSQLGKIERCAYSTANSTAKSGDREPSSWKQDSGSMPCLVDSRIHCSWSCTVPLSFPV